MEFLKMKTLTFVLDLWLLDLFCPIKKNVHPTLYIRSTVAIRVKFRKLPLLCSTFYIPGSYTTFKQLKCPGLYESQRLVYIYWRNKSFYTPLIGNKKQNILLQFFSIFCEHSSSYRKKTLPNENPVQMPPSWDRTQNYSYSVPWCLLTKVWTGEESSNSPAFTIIYIIYALLRSTPY